MPALLRRGLFLPLAVALILGLQTARACDRHPQGHGAGSDSASQIQRP